MTDLMSNIIGKKLSEHPVRKDFTRPHPHSSVGIEIEVEGLRTFDEKLTRWTISHDGSLQNGIEFISDPVWGTAIRDALDEMRALFKKHKPYLSFRTSVHVHLNILDINQEMLEHLVKLYVYYEPALFRLHKEWARYDNIFCVPVQKSMAIQAGYAALIRDIRNHRIGGPYVGYKYSAFNPNCIRDLGTVEFRHMGGTDDMDTIDQWINILLQLKVAAKAMVEVRDERHVWGDYHKYLTIRKKDFDNGEDMFEYIQANL